jgi:hypothetical protein
MIPIVNDNHIVAVVNNHATRLIIDHTVANNHIIPVANNDATMIVIHDRAVTDNHFRARDNNRIGSHYDWLHRYSNLGEQGLAMAETVEVQAHQAAPVAFEDEELLVIVIAPDLAAIDLVTLAVDNAELVAIDQHVGIVDLHFNVQVLLRPCLCRRGRSRTGLIKPHRVYMMPSWELNARAWISGLCDTQAAQHCYH